MPDKLLVPFSEAIADFGNRLGLALYGEWPSNLQHLMRSNPPDGLRTSDAGSDEEVVAFVRRQMQGGLARGLLTAGANVTENLGRARRALDISDDELHDWIVSPNVWDDEQKFDSIDWAKSVVGLKSDDLTCSGEDGETLGYLFPRAPMQIEAQISILRPEAPLAFINLDEVPTDTKIDRYNQYADMLLREANAAAWRCVALNEGELSIQNVIDYMTEYLGGTNLKPLGFASPSAKTLREVARKILEQLKTIKRDPEKHKTARVFFNSTPRERAKPDVDLF